MVVQITGVESSSLIESFRKERINGTALEPRVSGVEVVSREGQQVLEVRLDTKYVKGIENLRKPYTYKSGGHSFEIPVLTRYVGPPDLPGMH